MEKETEDFLDEKISKKKLEKRDKDEKSLFQRIMNVILWIVLFVWMGVVLFDYYHVSKNTDPTMIMELLENIH